MTTSAIIELARAIKAWWACYKIVRKSTPHEKRHRKHRHDK